jgi:hypothetical protein
LNVDARARANRLLLLTVVGLSALWGFRTLDRGWVPHDEGTLAQSAERVMHGQLPHRDFDEVYTGGLSAMNAAAFRALGVNLLTPRLVLFAFFLAWVPTLLYVATRFVSLPYAALATLLAVTWSIPNYPAAMPSWYNLFFAVFGLAAILRYIETDASRWLLAAGLAGGLSVLMKTSGIFFVAAGLLFLAYREQGTSRTPAAPGSSRREGVGYAVFATLLLSAFVALLFVLVGERSGFAGMIRFILPLGSLAAFLVGSEWTGAGRGPSAARFANLLRLGVPFVLGVAAPVVVLVLVYVGAGATGDLVRGLFAAPTRRLAFAATRPPGLATLWVVLPVSGLLLLDALPSLRWRRISAAVVALAGVALLAVPAPRALFPPMWYVLNALEPMVAVVGVAWLIAAARRGNQGARSQQVLAAVAVAGGVVLIQFPFSGAIYLFYALPALVPALMALEGRELGRRPVFVAFLAFLLLFSARWINSGALFVAGGFPYDPTKATARLDLPRGGNLRVSPHDKEQYERLVGAMRELSTSSWTFATPDLPEVYFLSGLRNPTPTLFDFFDEPAGRTDRILNTLDAKGVDVIVLNRKLRFSGPPPKDLLAGLRARYPRATIIGDFILRWRPHEPR